MPTHISVVDIALGVAASPGAQAITVPADAEGVVVFFSLYEGAASYSLSTLTASFVSGGFTINQSPDASDANSLVGVAYGLVTATGSQTITPTFTGYANADDGPIFQVAFCKDINPADWYRDSDHNNDDTGSSGVTSSTPAIDSAATDLVYGFTAEYSTIPTISGWTQQSTYGNDVMFGSVYTADSPGASTTTFTCATADFPCVAAISIKASAAATVDQEGFAFGDDDGNEASHTLDTQDTNVTVDVSDVKTLRVLLDGSGDPASAAYALRSQQNGSGGYVAVPVGATTTITPSPDTGDATETGNNTASGSWALGVPNASTGDLLIFCISWDDSTATTDVTEPAGQNGETLSEVNATPATDASTEVRCKVWYCKCTGAWSAGTITFTPSASEQWTGACIRIPAGEFDATTPIGASVTNASATDGTDVQCGAFSAGGSDGGGKLCVWTAADADPQTVATDFTEVANEDRGAVSGGFFTRDTAVTNSESISATTVSTIATDNWATVAFVVRPNVVTNELYIAASANVAAGGEATTARLSAPSGKTTGDFDTGRRWDDENGTDSIDITTDNYTELEWVLTTQSPATGGDYWDLRAYAGSTALDTYSVTPRLSISSGVTASGTPAAQSATTSGTAERSVTGSGTPAAQSASTAGTAEREITSAGTPAAQAAVVAGSGTVGGEITASGTPTAQAASTAGTAERQIPASGTPAAQAATTSGVAEREVSDTGSPINLQAQNATVSGSGQVGSEVVGSGAPVAQSATVAGTAERTITGSGTPAAQSATASGAAERVITSSGTPAAQAAVVTGSGSVGNAITGSGSVSAQSASVAGTANRVIPGSGAVASQYATATGVALRVITGSGTAASQSSTTTGVASNPDAASVVGTSATMTEVDGRRASMVETSGRRSGVVNG